MTNCLRVQLVTCIPTHRLPKNMVLGAASPEEIERLEQEVEEDANADEAGRGQILWIRGLTRLQHQVCRLIHYDNFGICSWSEGRIVFVVVGKQVNLTELELFTIVMKL